MKHPGVGIAIALLVNLAVAPTGLAGEGRYKPQTERGKAAGQIVRKWAGYVQNVYGASPMEWARSMQGTFAEADLKNLKASAGRATYEAMMGTLLGQKTSDSKVISTLAKSDGSLATIKSLGSPAEDLVYTMVTPCRIMDSRVAGGRLTSSVERSIAVHGTNFTSQGGSSTNCGIPSDPSAVAINIVTVAPSNNGFLSVYPSGTTRPLASNTNYSTGSIVANEIIAKTTLGQATDLTLFSQADSDVVIDIVGYFMAPNATALECQSTALASVTVAAGGTANTVAATCPSGYTQTATNCESSSWEMPFVFSNGGTCSARNNGASSASLRASRTCCRVPGR